MKKKQKIITINTVACLKHNNSDFEIHFRPNEKGNIFPLNIFQRLVWRFLGFTYYDGVTYIQYMTSLFKKRHENKM